MDNIIPISSLQSKAKKYVDLVRRTHEPIVITQRGKTACVLVDYDSYWGHRATQDEMIYSDWKKRLTQAQKESKRGLGKSLEGYLASRKRSRH
ncbi:MAG: type II toxin-antitoxin system Phd/YefM family antitoxin [Elusimicrobia bacterium]|nr:type II toxin-antitoxin system Phd/YefM family antitoxin [Elusimicrobiota bacterium]